MTAGWKDSPFGGSRTKDSDGDTQGSQEQIMGIKKTVDVHVVHGDNVVVGQPPRGRAGRDQFGEAM